MSFQTDDLNLSPDDLDLLAQLAIGLDAAEATPAHLKKAAYAARFMSNVDAELAALVFDSLNDAGPAMRRGSENQTRLLSFSNEFLTLDASLAADGCTIVGEIYPAVARVLHF